MRTRVEYKKENKEQIKTRLGNNGITILEDCHHLDGTYFMIDEPKRDLAKEIDEIKLDIATFKTV